MYNRIKMKKDNRKAEVYRSKPRINRVIATGLTGKFQGDQIEIDIGKTGNDTIIKVNGKKLDNVIGAFIRMRAGEINKLTLELIPKIK